MRCAARDVNSAPLSMQKTQRLGRRENAIKVFGLALYIYSTRVLSTRGNFYARRGVRAAISALSLWPRGGCAKLSCCSCAQCCIFCVRGRFAGVYDAIKASVLQPAVYKLGGQNAMITPIKLLSIAAQHTCTPLPRNSTVSEMICESISCCVDPEICTQLDLLVAPWAKKHCSLRRVDQFITFKLLPNPLSAAKHHLLKCTPARSTPLPIVKTEKANASWGKSRL